MAIRDQQSTVSDGALLFFRGEFHPEEPKMTMAGAFLLLAVAAFGFSPSADDITIPLDDGSILVRADFHEATDFGYRALYETTVYELRYHIKIQTASRWKTIELQFDLGGLCGGQPHQWRLPVTIGPLTLPLTFLPREFDDRRLFFSSAETKPFGKERISPLPKIDVCTVEIVKTALVSAESETTPVFHVVEPVDLTDALKAIQSEREAAKAEQAKMQAAEAAERVRREAAENAEQAKKDAAEAGRQKRLAAERKRKETEEAARLAKIRAEQDAIATEERRKIRSACAAIYQNTIDKKLNDLTVREEQQVRACQAVGLYPPQ